MERPGSILSEVWVRRSGVGLTMLIATVCIVLCFLNWTWLSGLEYGYFYGVFSDPPTYGLAAHGPNYFQSMNIWYLVIILCFLVYLAASFRQATDGFVIRIAALCVAIYPYFNMLSFKYDVIVNSGRRDYSWLQNSIYVDVFCLVAIVVLMCIEIFRLRRSTGKTGTADSMLKIGH